MQPPYCWDIESICVGARFCCTRTPLYPPNPSEQRSELSRWATRYLLVERFHSCRVWEVSLGCFPPAWLLVLLFSFSLPSFLLENNNSRKSTFGQRVSLTRLLRQLKTQLTISYHRMLKNEAAARWQRRNVFVCSLLLCFSLCQAFLCHQSRTAPVIRSPSITVF